MINPRSFHQQIWRNPIYFLAFGFGSGTLPIVPGTWGTVMAIPIFLLLAPYSLSTYTIITLVFFTIGVWLCEVTEKAIGVTDYSGIVWDEIVGFLFTMWAVPAGWAWVITGFILFRIFDMWKPWPISWCNKHIHGGFGIMFDDFLAAVPAWLILQIINYIFNS